MHPAAAAAASGLCILLASFLITQISGADPPVELRGAGDDRSRDHHIVWSAGYKALRKGLVNLDTGFRSIRIREDVVAWKQKLTFGNEYLALDYIQGDDLDLGNTSDLQLVPVASR